MFFNKITAIAILLFVFGQSVAQQDDDFFFGRLVDATTGEPVVFATVCVKGKVLGERESEIFDRFREFFTQKIIDDTTRVVPDSLLEKKMFSLGVKQQPKLKQKLDENFWMNTPLKSRP